MEAYLIRALCEGEFVIWVMNVWSWVLWLKGIFYVVTQHSQACVYKSHVLTHTTKRKFMKLLLVHATVSAIYSSFPGVSCAPLVSFHSPLPTAVGNPAAVPALQEHSRVLV